MPSAIWTGSISFGLVTVPVRMISATRSQDVRFHQLEEGTGARIRLPAGLRADRRRGAQRADRQGLRARARPATSSSRPRRSPSLKPKASRQIEIEDFVDLADIDPVYFEQPYYLVPDKDNAKAYRLLADVMEDLGKVAIGRFVLRSKEALVAIRPVDGVLVLETMRFADEVLAPDREQPLAEPASEPTEREKEMARQLVQLAHRGVRSRRSTTTSTARSCSRSSTRRPRARRSSRRPPPRSRRRCSTSWPRSRRASRVRARSRPTTAPRRRRRRSRRRTAKPAKRAAAKKASAKKMTAKKAPAKRTRKSA